MDAQISLTLDGPLRDFVEAQVASGRFSGAEDVLRAGLRLLASEDDRLAALRAALVEGEESGPLAPFDLEGFIAEKLSMATPSP